MHRNHHHSRLAASRFQRPASGYVLILGAATLVSVIGLSSLTLVRVQWRAGQAAIDAGQARLYAQSIIETTIAYTRADPDWRLNYATLASYMPMPVDRGYCSVAVTELDTSPLIANFDSPVLLTGIGTVGSFSSPAARARWLVQAHHPSLEVLRTALHSATSVYVSGALLELQDGPLSTAGTLTNTGTIQGDVEAQRINNWGLITGTVKSNVSAKQMPLANTWNYYLGQSTLVTLPASSVGGNFEWVVLSPESNPWESAKKSVDGLYYIRPGGDLHVRDCRIVGTLMVDLVPGKKLILENGVLWEPARPDYPSLVVNGICEIKLSTSVSEDGRVNLNPAGTPYEGQVDTDRWDTFPSILKGVFHVMGSSSTVLVDNQTRVKGVVIADGAVTIKGYPDLFADPNLFLSPPIKYRMSHLELDPGTFTPAVASPSP